MVALAAGHTALTPRVIRGMCQTMNAKSLRAHTIRALTGSGSPSFLNFFVVIRGNSCNGSNPLDFPRYRIRTGRTRVTIYSKVILSRTGSIAQVPHAWAYWLYTSCGRSLHGRGTTLVKESVLLLWDPTAQ